MGGSAISKYARQNGLRVKESKKPLTIEVTPHDIKGAKQKDPKACAFAKACMREQKVDAVFFFKTTAYVQKGKELTKFRMPPAMQNEIVSFDRGAKVQPGEYRLSSIPQSQTNKAARARGLKYRGKNKPGPHRVKDGSKRVKAHITKGIRNASLDGK